MPRSALSRRVQRLLAAANKSSATLHKIRDTLDGYMRNGIAPERALVAISLELGVGQIDELDASLAAFEGAV